MRKLLLALANAVVFATMLYGSATVSFAQNVVQITPVPQDKVAEVAKPLVGTFAAVACDSRPRSNGDVTPYGVRFSIRVDTIKTDEGDQIAPVFRLLALDPSVDPNAEVKPSDFQTAKFFIYKDKPVLVVMNPSLVIGLTTPDEHAIMTAIDGGIRVIADGVVFNLFAIKDPDPKSWDYVKTLSMLCPKPDNDDGTPQAKLMHATYTTVDTDDTDDQIQAAIDEFDRFVNAHSDVLNVINVLGREDVGKPWFARLYHENKDGGLTTWEEEGYPHIMAAVVAVERDFDVYPKGHSGTFEDGSK